MYKQNVNLNILEDNSKNKNKDNLKDSQLTASWPEWGRQYNTGMREKEENKKKNEKESYDRTKDSYLIHLLLKDAEVVI